MIAVQTQMYKVTRNGKAIIEGLMPTFDEISQALKMDSKIPEHVYADWGQSLMKSAGPHLVHTEKDYKVMEIRHIAWQIII